MSALQATGTLVNTGDAVTIGGPDATPAIQDQASCAVELLGVLNGRVVFEVSGPLRNQWYPVAGWDKTNPTALIQSTSALGLFMLPISSCVGVRVRLASTAAVCAVQVGMVASDASSQAYPGQTVTP